MLTGFLMLGGPFLGGPFLRMLLCNVTPDNAAADGSDDRVVARVMSGYAAHDGAFQAAGGIGCSSCHESKRGGGNEHPDSVSVIKAHGGICLFVNQANANQAQ
jgi:hypothetical protein